MAQKITREMIDHYCTSLNRVLTAHKSDVQYKIVGQNGGLTIEYWKGTNMIDTLRSNLTTRECFYIIHGMQTAVIDGIPLPKGDKAS